MARPLATHKTTALQFRTFVIRPTLENLGLHSPAAENLVLGTALHESGGFRFFDQWTGADDVKLGPAFGLYQIEPATHDDVLLNFVSWRPKLRAKLSLVEAPIPSPHEQLVTNLAYATAICRLIYYRRPEPLPAADDLPGLARYWKKFYNTSAGAGTEAQFIEAFTRFH